MNMNIFNFAQKVLGLFASWLTFESREWAWCPVRVNNRIDRF